jgi:hypothetical protein
MVPAPAAVAIETRIDFEEGTTRCNCSRCAKSRFWFAIIQADDFNPEKGEDQLSDCRWLPPGKTKAHLHYRLCETCGVRAFAQVETASHRKFHVVAIAAWTTSARTSMNSQVANMCRWPPR